MVPDARGIPEFIARAMRLAFSGRRGPVHLTIPIDVQEQSVEENEIAFIRTGRISPQRIELLPTLEAGAPRHRALARKRAKAAGQSPAAPLVTRCPATLCGASSKPRACRS